MFNQSKLQAAFSKIKGNQKGVAGVLAVVVISFTIVTTLSTVYIYLVNRAKYHSRIREAYQMNQVMEEFGKTFRQAYDTAQASKATPSSAVNCPSPTAAWPSSGPIQFCLTATTPNGMQVPHLGQNYTILEFGIVTDGTVTPAGGGGGGGGAVDEGGGEILVPGPETSSLEPRMNSKKQSLWANWSQRLDRHYQVEAASAIDRVAANAFPFLNIKMEQNSLFGESANAYIGDPDGKVKFVPVYDDNPNTEPPTRAIANDNPEGEANGKDGSSNSGVDNSEPNEEQEEPGRVATVDSPSNNNRDEDYGHYLTRFPDMSEGKDKKYEELSEPNDRPGIEDWYESDNPGYFEDPIGGGGGKNDGNCLVGTNCPPNYPPTTLPPHGEGDNEKECEVLTAACIAQLCAEQSPRCPHPEYEKVQIQVQAPNCNGPRPGAADPARADYDRFCEPCGSGTEQCWKLVVCGDPSAGSNCSPSRTFTQFFKVEAY